MTSRKFSYVVLSGGVGGAKLVQGLSLCLPHEQLLIVGNTGDDFEHWGLRISPDLDTLMYTLAGIADPDTGWGRADETWHVLEALSELGQQTWFKLGDQDLAVHIERSRRLREGVSLSVITDDLCRAFGIRLGVVPVTDDRVHTIVETKEGPLEFQRYFVHHRCEPVVTGLQYDGAAQATLSPIFQEALESPTVRAVILCPSNPFLSLDPMLSIADLRCRLQDLKAPVIAVSPMIGSRAFKGPTAKIMKELGHNPSTLFVAEWYADILDGYVIDTTDEGLCEEIEKFDIHVKTASTLMTTMDQKRKLAAAVLSFSDTIHGHRPLDQNERD